MSGIDRQDQIMSYYPAERKTLRWYKKIAIHFIQICLLNSHILYCKNIKKINYYDYRLSVIKALLSSKSNPAVLQICPQIPERHFPCKVKSSKITKIDTWCRVCATVGKREETIYYCNKCDSQPELCFDPCFENFHKKL